MLHGAADILRRPGSCIRAPGPARLPCFPLPLERGVGAPGGAGEGAKLPGPALRAPVRAKIPGPIGFEGGGGPGARALARGPAPPGAPTRCQLSGTASCSLLERRDRRTPSIERDTPIEQKENIVSTPRQSRRMGQHVDIAVPKRGSAQALHRCTCDEQHDHLARLLHRAGHVASLAADLPLAISCEFGKGARILPSRLSLQPSCAASFPACWSQPESPARRAFAEGLRLETL
jgi:hypothetical protein